MNTLIRIIWFLFVGWWLGLMWVGFSILTMCTLILLPVGAYMLTKTWKLMTLSETPKTIITNVINVKNEEEPKKQRKSKSKSKFCSDCGKKVNGKFCKHCGEKT
jgi:uncharacterized membrane protein YccF (DUF307 family)